MTTQTEFRLIGRRGYFRKAEKIGPYSFPEKWDSDHHGATVYDSLKLAKQARERLGYDARTVSIG